LVGAADKKRVAIALTIFNVVTDAIAFVFLQPILRIVTVFAGITDPLFALVAFHSLFNLIGIIIFLPSIGLMSRKLSKLFSTTNKSRLRHIKKSDLAVPEAAIENISRETYRLIDQAAALNQISLGLQPTHTFYASDSDRQGVDVFRAGANHESSYAGIKQLEGEILAYALQLQEERLDADESARLGQVIVAIRNAVHAAKTVKDTHHDLHSFRESVDDQFNAWFGYFQNSTRDFFELLDSVQSVDVPAHRFEILVELKNKNEALHMNMHADIYKEVARGHLTEVQISTLLNVNRELYLSNQGLLASLADVLLDAASAADYESIPVST
jgi:phosphate:Na+ symporter